MLIELNNQKDTLVNQMRDISATATKEKRVLNSDERTKLERIKSDLEAVAYQIQTETIVLENQRSEAKKVFDKEERKANDRFDLGKAMRSLVAGTAQDGIEKEMLELGQQAVRKAGRTPGGNEIFLPLVIVGQRAVQTTSTEANWLVTKQAPDLNIVQTPILYKQLGITQFNGIEGGKLDLPVLPDYSNVTYDSENSSLTELSISPGKATLSAKFLPVQMTLTRELLAQTNPQIQQAVFDTFMYSLDKSIDKQLLFNTITGATASFTGTTSTYPNLLKLEASINDIATAFVTSFRGRNYLKSTEKSSSGTVGNFMWGGTQADNSVMGYPGLASPQTPAIYALANWARAFAMGDFSGGVGIIYDPYSSKSTGGVSVQYYKLYDVQVWNSAALAWSKGSIV